MGGKLLFQLNRLKKYLHGQTRRDGSFFEDFSLGDPLLEHARNLRLNETKLALRRPSQRGSTSH
ncbi:MAG: hypothetical protein ACTSU5_20055 [Promethearchaeota archaeon]